MNLCMHMLHTLHHPPPQVNSQPVGNTDTWFGKKKTVAQLFGDGFGFNRRADEQSCFHFHYLHSCVFCKAGEVNL